jgi:hypothetical protein
MEKTVATAVDITENGREQTVVTLLLTEKERQLFDESRQVILREALRNHDFTKPGIQPESPLTKIVYETVMRTASEIRNGGEHNA